MGGLFIPSATILVVVVTVLAPCAWAETGSGSLSQKIRRESRESDGYWPKDVGITDQQLRQLLANSLSNSYDTAAADHLRDAKQQGYLYGNRLGDTGLDLQESDEGAVKEGPATPRGATQLRASKRNGFFYGKRNGFFYGKRSGATQVDAVNECTRCGPQNSGQCVMFGTCCSYTAGGCYFLTGEALPCVTSNMSSLCHLRGDPCGKDGYGRCVADSVCCSTQEGACHVDTACSKPTY